MSNRRWSHKKLQHNLRKLLQDERVHIYLEAVPQYKMADAHTSWSTSKPIVVVIDPARGEGLVRSAIHELLHVILDDTMWPFSEEVEESFVSALEADIFANMEDEGWTHEFLALVEARVAGTPPRVNRQPKASPLRSSQKPSQPVTTAQAEPIALALKDKARPS